MKAIEMLKTNGPIREEYIRAIELSLGAELPEYYRGWMLECNGGFPSRINNFIDRDHLNPPLRCSVGIEWFLSLDEIIKVRKTYSNRIQSHFIPIAEDGNGNYVCIALFGEERGAIFFWDHDIEPAAYAALGETSYLENVTKIADNFLNFLEQLDREPDFLD